MNRILGVILLVVGIALIVMGIQASDSVASSFSRLFNGSPTDKAIWLLIGGAVATGLGIVVMTRRDAAQA
jgi:drug/metabolite transporter (DMT)-like permease